MYDILTILQLIFTIIATVSFIIVLTSNNNYLVYIAAKCVLAYAIFIVVSGVITNFI